MTVVRVIRLRLIWQPSLSLVPSACDCDALSLPAKSTKFCNEFTNPPIKHIKFKRKSDYWKEKGSFFTRLAMYDLTQSEFSRWVLCIVWFAIKNLLLAFCRVYGNLFQWKNESRTLPVWLFGVTVSSYHSKQFLQLAFELSKRKIPLRNVEHEKTWRL